MGSAGDKNHSGTFRTVYVKQWKGEKTENKRAVAYTESCVSPAERWASGSSPAPRARVRQTDALLQLHSQAAHAKSKFPVEAGTFDRLVAEDTAFANKKDKPNVIDSRGLEGKHLKFAASRLHGTNITHCKAQAGLHKVPGPPPQPCLERKGFQHGLTVIPGCFLLSYMKVLQQRAAPCLTKREQLDPVLGWRCSAAAPVLL